MISIHQLSKKFGEQAVLNDINLSFSRGKVYGIVGENGAGKTTLFRCLAGLESYKGSITAEHSPLKNHLGLLLTEPFFFPKITGEEYLRLLCNARKIELDKLDEKNIFDLPLKEYAANYSTGMKKKLAITAILLQKNDYFILDEPFNGVDIESNILITAIIKQLKDLNKVVMISSHIFSTLRDTCDEIHLLSKGEHIKTVQSRDFDVLEKEMTNAAVGNKLKQLELI